MIACQLKLIFFVLCDAKLLWYLTKATAKCTFEPRTKSQEKVTQSQKSNCHWQLVKNYESLGSNS